MQALIVDRPEKIADLCRKHPALFGLAARDDFDPERSEVDSILGLNEAALPESVLQTFNDLRVDVENVHGRKVDFPLQEPVRTPVLSRSDEADLLRFLLRGRPPIAEYEHIHE